MSKNRISHFLLVGHEGSHNRGCEALVRSSVLILREQFPNCRITLASMHPDHDGSLADVENLEIIPGICHIPYAYKEYALEKKARKGIPSSFNGFFTRKLDQIRQLLVKISIKWDIFPSLCPTKPNFDMVLHLREVMLSADAVIIIGGDLFIEDWGIPEYPLQVAGFAQHLGCKTVLWGASIWPIKNKYIQNRVAAVLSRCDILTLRDATSIEYLQTLNITNNVFRVADGAFLMDKQSTARTPVKWHTPPSLIIGFNGSYVFQNFLTPSLCKSVIIELTKFIQYCIDTRNAGIVLIPHDYEPGANERDFLWEINSFINRPGRVFFPPIGLSAPETKAVISQCDLCITMRFHASIASLSQGIPTLGIAYSPKFEGLFDCQFFVEIDPQTRRVQHWETGSLQSRRHGKQVSVKVFGFASRRDAHLKP